MANSVVLIKRGGKRETETTLLAADGLNVMVNPDGGLIVELYADGGDKAYRFALDPATVKTQAHNWQRLARHS